MRISVSYTYTKVNIKETYHAILKNAFILFLNLTYLPLLQAIHKDWLTTPWINWIPGWEIDFVSFSWDLVKHDFPLKDLGSAQFKEWHHKKKKSHVVIEQYALLELG